MAQEPPLKRYLDAGIAFTNMTRARAEAIVKDLVTAGELQAAQAQKLVEDLVDRSRKNTEALVEQVSKELRDQVANMRLATQGDIARLEGKIAKLEKGKAAAPARKAAKKAPARKAAATKSPR